MRRLQSAIVSIFLVTAGLLITSLILIYIVGRSALNSHREVASDRAVLQHLEETLSTLKDAETGQRGYLLLGDEDYLTPYRKALERIHAEQESLRRLAADGKLPVAGVQAIIRLSGEKLTELEQTIQLRRQGGLSAALPLIRSGEGKATMDALRAEVGAETAIKERKLQEDLQHASRAVNARTSAYVLMAAFYLAVLAWAYLRITREIRQREAAVLETARQKELLATTLASIGDGVIATDPEGRVNFLNGEAERLTGWKSAEAVGRPLPSVFHIINEGTRQPVENPVDKVLRHGGVVGLANHTILVAKNGTEIPIDDSAAPIRQPNGPLFGVVLVFRDFTAQRKAQETGAHLAAIVQYSGDAILTKDLHGAIQTWNPSAERLFGYKPDEIIGKSVTRLVPPDLLEEEKEIIQRLQQGQPSERRETFCLAKDGRRVPVSVSVSPIKDAEGRVVGASKIIHDISELVAAREALAQERELLATTLASIGDAVIVTDPEGRIRFLNREAELLTGWKNPEAQEQLLPSVFRIISEQTRKPVENPVDKVLRLGKVVGLANHTLLIAKDSREIPIDDSAAPIRRLNGPLFGVVLVFRDFTERRQLEEKLRALALLPAQNPAPVLRAARSGTLLYANPAALELFREWNLNVGQMAPDPICSIAVEALKASQSLDRELAVGSRSYLVSVAPIPESGYANFYCLDITARKQAEEALRESEAQFRQIADAMPQIVWTARPDGYLDYYNERWYEFTGFPRGQFGQSSWEPILHPEDVQRCLETYFGCIREARPYHIEYRFKDRSTGGYRWFMGRALPVRNERGEIVRWFGTCTDIDDQKRAEEILQQAVEERTVRLREVISELQHVSYAMVHDMRAPLRAMQAFAQMLTAKSSEETPEERLEFLQRIMTGASRLDKLIQDALNYNKAVLQEVPLQPIDLSALLPSLIRTYPNLDPSRAEIRLEPGLPVVLGNESLLTLCFSNLLSNAAKFVAPGVHPRIAVRAEPKDATVRIWVEDNGIGIGAHARTRLFGMFQKLDAQYEGTGIGLAIVRKVVERMGGTVGAESQPGSGSRFWVELQSWAGRALSSPRPAGVVVDHVLPCSDI